MDLTTLTYIAVGLSFALYIGIAIWAKASTTGEFYVAGKGVNPVVNLYLHGWSHCLSWLWRLGLPDGLDRWLLPTGDASGTLPS